MVWEKFVKVKVKQGDNGVLKMYIRQRERPLWLKHVHHGQKLLNFKLTKYRLVFIKIFSSQHYILLFSAHAYFRTRNSNLKSVSNKNQLEILIKFETSVFLKYVSAKVIATCGNKKIRWVPWPFHASLNQQGRYNQTDFFLKLAWSEKLSLSIH